VFYESTPLLPWSTMSPPKPDYALYFDSGYRSSFKLTPNSSRSGLSSSKYCSYWPLFSTFALIPIAYHGQLRWHPLKPFLSTRPKTAHTLEDPNRCGKVVDPSGRLQCCRDDWRWRDEIVGKGIVKVSLWDNRTIISRLQVCVKQHEKHGN